MASNPPKRRKLDSSPGGPTLDNSQVPIRSTTPNDICATAFVLETMELLKRLQMEDYDIQFPTLDQNLREIKETIGSLEQYGPVSINEALTNWESTNYTAIPFPDPKPPKDCPYKVSFEKPDRFNVVGSYGLGTLVHQSGHFVIDLTVAMPATLFSPKDYRNFRYFYKRAFFLAYIANGLRKKLTDFEFAYSNLNGNILQPVLLARPPAKTGASFTGQKYDIRIIPTAPEGYFPTAKLLPTRDAIGRNGAEESKETTVPTPYYNNTLKSESQFIPYWRLLHHAATICNDFQHACKLGRIWLQQRGFSSDIADGGFGHFHWALLTALLLETGGGRGEPLLSPSLHYTQLFKGVLQYIALSNIDKKPMLLGSDEGAPEDLRQAGPFLYDSARHVNILSNMTACSASRLVEYAKASISASYDPQVDWFSSLFITKLDRPLLTSDLFVKINTPSNVSNIISGVSDGRNSTAVFAEHIFLTLKKALGERAKLINIQLPQSSTRKVTLPLARPRAGKILVSIMCDQVKASQGRDFGPSQDQEKEAADFREFWGDVAGLWQFSSGEIVQTIDWTEFSSLGYFGICQAIIRHILKLRLKLTDSGFEIHGQEFSNLISVSPGDKASFDAAIAAFAIFEKDLRALDDLPLSIRAVTPIGSETRYASLRLPHTNERKRGGTPIEALILFETSGKWPKNLAAVQRIKIAFLLRIGRSLEKAKDGIKTHLGLEDREQEIENLAFLDVVYESGYSFRLRAHSDQEAILLQTLIDDPSKAQHIRAEAADQLRSTRWRGVILPFHNQTIATYCSRFPALSSSIRLTKQWFNAHRLGNHFNEPLIELFVLQAFVQSHPFPTPSSASTGFMRTLLLLASYNWKEEDMIVDPSGSLSAAQRLEFSMRMETMPKTNSNRHGVDCATLWIGTPFDMSGSAYTHDTPTVVARRLSSLAQSAWKAAKDKGIGLDPRTLFRSRLQDYDVVIHLSAKAIKGVIRHDGAKHSHFKNLDQSGGSEALPLPESPIPAFLRRLTTTYATTLLFFHGGPDDTVIPALWLPSWSTVHQPGKPTSLKPEDPEMNELKVNKEAILAEIARIGGDLIESIKDSGREPQYLAGSAVRTR
ncbi:pre-rRNA processing protein utp22 [Xylaria intraflava]|nr:pre-rRNA processing protein utp22 [Xylaria intraflava]